MLFNRQAALTIPSSEKLVSRLLLAAGLGCGLLLPALLQMPTAMALAGVAVLAGALVFALLALWGAPLIPVLRLALLASFACRLEVELFPAFAQDEMLKIGISLSHTLFLSILLLAAKFFSPLTPARRRFPVFPVAGKVFLGGLVIWSCLSVVYGVNTWRGICALWLFGSSLLTCGALAYTLDSRAAWRQAVVCVALMLGVGALVALGQYGFGMFGESLSFIGAPIAEDQLAIGGGDVRRVGSFLNTPTAYAGYLVALLPLPLASLLLRTEQVPLSQRLIIGGGAVLGLVGLIITYSRGAWMAFGAAIVFLALIALYLLEGAARSRLALKLTGALVLCAICTLPFAAGIYVRLTEDDNDSAASRPPANKVALAVIEAHPLTGVGLGAYSIAAPRYDLTQDEITTVLIAVHNIFLHVTAETGIPGLLLFLGFMLCATWYGGKTLRYGDNLMQAVALGLLTGLWGFLLNGMKEPGSLGTKRLDLRILFLLCGMLLAAWRTTQITMAEGEAAARHE